MGPVVISSAILAYARPPQHKCFLYRDMASIVHGRRRRFSHRIMTMYSNAVRIAILIISTSACFVATAATEAKGQEAEQKTSVEETESPRLREARELSTSRDLRNTHRLLVLLKDSDERVRLAAAEALGFVLYRYVIGPGVSMGGEDPHPLEYLRYKTSAPSLVSGYRSALLHALSDPSPSVRAATLKALGKIFEGTGGGEALEAPDDITHAILLTLNDPNDDLASAAVDSVAEIKIRAAIPRLMALLQRSNPEIRLKALYVLNWTNIRGPKGMIPFASLQKDTAPFSRLLKDPDAKVREQASLSLDFMCQAKLCDAGTVSRDRECLKGTMPPCPDPLRRPGTQSQVSCEYEPHWEERGDERERNPS